MAERIDQPRPGFYSTHLVRGGIKVGVRIWFGRPIIDGEEQDRSPRLCVEVDGRTDRLDRDEQTGEPLGRVPLDVDEVWPFCRPITEAEYRYLRRLAVWAQAHAPDHPAANPRDPIELRAMKPLF
jgi:hypothetical protein